MPGWGRAPVRTPGAGARVGAYRFQVNRNEILDQIRREGGLPDGEVAFRATRAVVCGLRDRLSADEVRGLEEALTGDLADLLSCGVHVHKPPSRQRERLTEPEFVERVQLEARLPDRQAARQLVRIVFQALSSRLGEEREETVENVARAVGSLGETPRDRGGSGNDEE